jgi:hypothetical protein
LVVDKLGMLVPEYMWPQAFVDHTPASVGHKLKEDHMQGNMVQRMLDQRGTKETRERQMELLGQDMDTWQLMDTTCVSE